MRKKLCTRALADRAGATSIEYGLIAAVLSLALFSGVGVIGQSLSTSFERVAANLEDSLEPGTGMATASIASGPELLAVDVVGSVPD
ncbi:Flp pilus assembly protein, pilin Flp [Hoeflea phototrophica DFL-43]|uniref:Flp pilus assembly protein, pilin Flp n=1 Tax=Hoeflea phototrophica (strain DSM 17068 / NCIMB 14078 / DFL-43) TaxID=411684 RepID=A9D3F0_HOEPD|nr:Flp family type IVb pilin [Hoeflea phototrophica]EDQ33666.1 Flp pilus assembly protein, pilin Flp [Hoeflea phototrophica DFL-43]